MREKMSWQQRLVVRQWNESQVTVRCCCEIFDRPAEDRSSESNTAQMQKNCCVTPDIRNFG